MSELALLQRVADVMRRCDPNLLREGEASSSDAEWDVLVAAIDHALMAPAVPIAGADKNAVRDISENFFGTRRPKLTVEHEGRTFEVRVETHRGADFITAIHQLVASPRSPYPSRRKVFPCARRSEKISALLVSLGADERGRLRGCLGGVPNPSHQGNS